MGDSVDVMALPPILFSPSMDNCKELNSGTMSMILDNHRETKSLPLMTSLENHKDVRNFSMLAELENEEDLKSLPLMIPENNKDIGAVPLNNSQENHWPFSPPASLENHQVLETSLENYNDCRPLAMNSSFDNIKENIIFTPFISVENEKINDESGVDLESPIDHDEFLVQLKTDLELKENSTAPRDENIKDSNTITMPPTPEEDDNDKEVTGMLENGEDTETKWKFPLPLESETNLNGLESDLDVDHLDMKAAVKVLNPENEDVEMVEAALPVADEIEEMAARSVEMEEMEEMEKEQLQHLKPIRVVPISDSETETGSDKIIKMKKLGVTVRKMKLIRHLRPLRYRFDDDEYLYCDECEKLNLVECKVHPRLQWVKDSVQTKENASLKRAWATLPPGLKIKKSSIPGAGRGVFASDQRFPVKSVFGPYGGRKIFLKNIRFDMDGGYMWDIVRDGVITHVVDGKDQTKGNWMRFINCARHEEEQNLVAFQYHGSIYYRAYKPIEPGTELLVWYGNEYANELDVLQKVNASKSQNGKDFPCPKCELTFTGPSHLLRHIKYTCGRGTGQLAIFSRGIHGSQHMNAKPFKCSVCAQTFLWKSSLNYHRKKHKGIKVPKLAKCKKCGEAFVSRPLLKKHYRTAHSTESKPHICTSCGKGFRSRARFINHCETHKRGKREYKCNACKAVFQTCGELYQHKCIPRVPEPLKIDRSYCKICGKHFPNRTAVINHMVVHTRTRNHHCTLCDKHYGTNGALNKHRRLHHKNLPFFCRRCGENFRDLSLKKEHMRIHSENDFYKCKYCEEEFTLAADMNMHICKNGVVEAGIEEKASTPPPPQKQSPAYEHNKHRCKYCLKSFPSLSQLEKHVTTHPDVKRAVCPYCHRKFSTVSNLNVHVRLHTGEKPYTCPQCNKAFGTIRQRKAHKCMSGSACTQKTCSVCLKNFKHQLALNSHMRLHKLVTKKVKSENVNLATTRRKKACIRANSSTLYSCSQCRKSFSQQLALNSHMRIHKSEEKSRDAHSCPRCHRSFSTASNMRKHRKTVRCKELLNDSPAVVDALESQNTEPPDTDYRDENEPALQLETQIQKSQTRSRSASVPIITDMESLEPEMLQSRNRRASLPQVAVTEKDNTYQTKEDCDPCNGSIFSQGGQLVQTRRVRKRASEEVSTVETVVEYLNPPLKFRKKTGLQRYLTKYSCKYCLKRFPRNKLAEHVRIHTGEKPYRCQFCDMQFGQKANMKRHLALHPKDKPYRCAKCKKHFVAKHVLRRHNAEVDCKAVYRKGDVLVKPKKFREGSYSGHKDKVAVKPMEQLDRRYGRNVVVKQQRKRAHTCGQCGLVFHAPFSFKSHKCDTTAVRPYACDYCPNRYFLKHHMKRHMTRVHLNVCVAAKAKFSCPYCSKTFQQKPSYNHHIRLHDTPRQHKCNRCGKGFLNASLLKYHSARHSNKRPYSCDDCGGKFKLQQYLSAHRKICPGPTTV